MQNKSNQNKMIYTGPKLIELLEQQHQQRANQQGLFQQGIFTLTWRAKVGSYPHPDLETIISAAEPAGNWQYNNKEKLNVAKNWKQFPQLPLNGYIPASSLRGLVRSWAKQNQIPTEKIRELLGDQDTDTIYTGKIHFLDAYPLQPTPITLDIVNPQQSFQVYHQGQSTPLSFYTLGDGEKSIDVKIAIRGIPGQTTPAEVQEVWGWLEQAVCLLGIGGRTASGYGTINKESVKPRNLPNYANKILHFEVYSQGSYGVNQGKDAQVQLRPSHWRGWLRSWLLRFFLGVMSKADAEKTLGELLGSIGDDNNNQAQKGCLRLKVHQGKSWGEKSKNAYTFYTWKGQLEIIAPKDIVNEIVLPVIKFALSVGGVGRGWRRPLHLFKTDKSTATRGCYLKMNHQVKDKLSNLALHPNQPDKWQKTYAQWLEAVKSRWSNRVKIGAGDRLEAEVFSPTTCAIYAVLGPEREPIDFNKNQWKRTNPVEDTRGDGMELIYHNKYKRQPAVGGNAGTGNGAHCSWVSIRRVGLKHPEYDVDTQEIVCLFMGGKTWQDNHLRSNFLQDLNRREGKIHLFGVKPEQ